MSRVAFILGAGAHIPFGFPDGEELKRKVAHELTDAPADFVADYHAAKRALLDCGVSIDRFLATNRPLSTMIRPRIAKVLLEQERQSIDTGMIDWLAYVWPLMLGKTKGELNNRLIFVTFNYDRTLEYRLARAAAGLWGMPLIDACNMLDQYGVYHVYGSLGPIGTKSGNQITYGRIEACWESGQQIKIIGEHTDKTTREIHTLLSGASQIYMLGCGFHPENMEVLALDQLSEIAKGMPLCTCAGLMDSERSSVATLYPYLSLFHESQKASPCATLLEQILLANWRKSKSQLDLLISSPFGCPRRAQPSSNFLPFG